MARSRHTDPARHTADTGLGFRATT